MARVFFMPLDTLPEGAKYISDGIYPIVKGKAIFLSPERAQ
ncbi:hypothetical protein V6R21_30690 [Limibacter armeniacum]